MEKDPAVEIVASKILLIRGRKVILDRDLAEMYGVTTGLLTRQVRRNIKRFPEDFMHQLNSKEFIDLKCQFGISSWGGTRKLPYVFTEQGIAMLSGVLHSDRAIAVNIAIMRAFVKLREFLLTHKELAEKIAELEQRVGEHDKNIVAIFEVMKKMLAPPAPKPQIGFK